MFWQNEEFVAGLAREINLDGVVCVVDAVFGEQACLLRNVIVSVLNAFTSKWLRTIPQRATLLVKACGNSNPYYLNSFLK
jgi:hypothetical protein